MGLAFVEHLEDDSWCCMLLCSTGICQYTWIQFKIFIVCLVFLFGTVVHLVLISQTEGLAIPAHPSFVCFFSKGSIKDTDVLIILVDICVCMYI